MGWFFVNAVDFFSYRSVFFYVLGSPVSYLEFWSMLTGGFAVVLLARNQVWGWPIGLINISLLGILFFQVQLYADVLLQVFFFMTSLVGWRRWRISSLGEAKGTAEFRVSWMSMYGRVQAAGLCGLFTFLLAHLVVRFHRWFPMLFAQPSAFPYLDSLITVASVLATFMAIRKKIESWVLWMVVDALAVGVYLVRGIGWVSIQYGIFFMIALFGFWNWRKIYQSYVSCA